MESPTIKPSRKVNSCDCVIVVTCGSILKWILFYSYENFAQVIYVPFSPVPTPMPVIQPALTLTPSTNVVNDPALSQSNLVVISTIGGICILVLIAIFLVYIRRRRKKERVDQLGRWSDSDWERNPLHSRKWQLDGTPTEELGGKDGQSRLHLNSASGSDRSSEGSESSFNGRSSEGSGPTLSRKLNFNVMSPTLYDADISDSPRSQTGSNDGDTDIPFVSLHKRKNRQPSNLTNVQII